MKFHAVIMIINLAYIFTEYWVSVTQCVIVHRMKDGEKMWQLEDLLVVYILILCLLATLYVFFYCKIIDTYDEYSVLCKTHELFQIVLLAIFLMMMVFRIFYCWELVGIQIMTDSSEYDEKSFESILRSVQIGLIFSVVHTIHIVMKIFLVIFWKLRSDANNDVLQDSFSMTNFRSINDVLRTTDSQPTYYVLSAGAA